MIQEWFKELLIDGIISNLTGMFDTLNTKVGEIAGEVGMTPAAWNSSIFNMIRNLSETVIVPIAGIILTFVMCYELIQLIIEKNNLHDFDTWIFFKWIFKTFCAVLIVTNTWNIVMAVFDVAQNVVSQSAGVIISDAGIDISGVVGNLETQLADWSVGALLGLWFQSVFVGLCTQILSICIFLVIYGRMIEVYLVTSMSSRKRPMRHISTRKCISTGCFISLPSLPEKSRTGRMWRRSLRRRSGTARSPMTSLTPGTFPAVTWCSATRRTLPG